MSTAQTATIPVYNWKDIPVRESRKGIFQRVFRGQNVLIGCSELHPHMDPSPHGHPYEQIFMITKGRVKLHVADEVFTCTAGSVIRIPPNVEHWSEPPDPADGMAINMDIWTPYRPDFGAFTSYQTDKFDAAESGGSVASHRSGATAANSSKKKAHCYNWNTIPSANPRPGVVQRGFRGGKIMVSQAELHPTMSGNPHSHDLEQIFMILKGRVTLHIGDQVHTMTEGSIVRIPPNVVHWSEPPSKGDGVAINLDIFSIIRDDHLKLVTYQADDFSTEN